MTTQNLIDVRGSTSGNGFAAADSAGSSIGSLLDRSPPSDPHFDDDGDNKICRICGDKALGYNFNVISCESCKAFFRRNATKVKEFRCPSKNNCAITVASRRFCQRCRLKKCFEEGMKKEWIMSDDALLERRQRNDGRRFDTLGGDSASRWSNSTMRDSYSSSSPPTKRVDYGSAKSDLSLTSPFRNPNDYVLNRSPANFDWSPSHWTASGLTTPIPMPVSGFVPSSATEESSFFSPTTASGSKGSFGVVVPIANSSPMSNFSPASPYLPTLLPTQPYHQTVTGRQEQRQMHFSSPFSIEPTPIGPLRSLIPDTNSQLKLPREEAPQPTRNDNEYIYVPKSVLANLVGQCYNMLQTGAADRAKTDQGGNSSQCPPVLTRVKQLTDRENAKIDHRTPLDCICQCLCGAKMIGSKIGIEKSDKCFGTEHGDQSSKHAETENHICGKAGVKSSAAWLSLDSRDSDIWHDSSLSADQPFSLVPGMSLFKWLRMEELIAANSVMNEPTDFSQFVKETGDNASNAVDVTMMTNICIRRIIRMCKRIGAFKTLCQADQIALLKGSCTEILVLRGVMAYNAESDTFDVNWYPTSQAQIKLDVLKGVKGNCYNEHKKYLQSFEEPWRRDERIMLTLGALTLFNPDRRNVVHRDVVSREHEFYWDLLKNYLDISYNDDLAQRYYLELCDRLSTLQRCVNDYAATIFLDVNPRDLEPLLLEIFDLKDYRSKSE